MKIQLDDKHYLNSDQYCYWITCTQESKNGKPYERRVSGYTDTFSSAVDSYIEKSIIGSESSEIKELCEKIEDLKREIREWKVNIDEICRQTS